MISFPLFYIAIPFLLIIGIWAIFAFFNVVTTFKFGYLNYASYLMTVLFLGASIIVLFLTWQALQDVDWQQSISINNSL